jgi:mono/diheme cytochrome c family protein
MTAGECPQTGGGPRSSRWRDVRPAGWRLVPLIALTVALSPCGAAPVRAETAAGQEAYERRCGICHSSPAPVLLRMPQGQVDEKRQWLAKILRTHHARDEETRDRIIEWLLAQ